MSSCFAFVFARGGSKGVPRKNLQTVGGLTLVARSIITAQQTPGIDRVIVSTDDAEIAEQAAEYGADVPELRPEYLSHDGASELDAWKHAVGWFLDDKGRPNFDIFMSVPPTAPLRTPDTLKRCLDLLNADCDMVVTGSASARHPAFNMVSRDAQGLVKVAHPSASGVTRRQDTPPLYDLTTVAYVSRPHHILTIGSVLEGRVKMLEIDRRSAIDIDDEFDLEVAQLLCNEEGNHE